MKLGNSIRDIVAWGPEDVETGHPAPVTTGGCRISQGQGVLGVAKQAKLDPRHQVNVFAAADKVGFLTCTGCILQAHFHQGTVGRILHN